jgi:predicted dehydrogenase
LVELKVGVIGVGQMGANHARVYSEFKNVEELYIFDNNPSTTRTIADRYGAYPCETQEELFSSVDVVDICVPTEYHYETMVNTILYNLPFLVEKPLCGTLEEAESIFSSLPDNVICGVGHIERFNPIIAEIKKIVKHPLYIECHRHNPGSKRITNSTVIEDLMIHDIDVVFNVLLKKWSVDSGFGYGTDDIYGAFFKFADTPVYLSASRRSAKKTRTIYIEDEDFTVVGDYMSQEVYTYLNPEKYSIDHERYVQENIIEKVVINKIEPLRTELATFLDCVEDQRQFPVTIEEAIYNLKICDSIRSG